MLLTTQINPFTHVMSTRILSASRQDRFQDKLESIGVNEFVEGVAMDQGHYIAVVHEEDTTYIDTLENELNDHKEFAGAVASILAEDELDSLTKLAQLDLVMAEADDRGLLPDRFSDSGEGEHPNPHVGERVDTLDSDASESASTQ